MSMKPETALVNKIRRYILTQSPEAVVIKIHGSAMQEEGLPDIIGGLVSANKSHGLIIIHFALEVKLPGEAAEPLQIHQLKRLQNVGYCVGVVHSVEETDEVLYACYNAMAASRAYRKLDQSPRRNSRGRRDGNRQNSIRVDGG